MGAGHTAFFPVDAKTRCQTKGIAKLNEEVNEIENDFPNKREIRREGKTCFHRESFAELN